MIVLGRTRSEKVTKNWFQFLLGSGGLIYHGEICKFMLGTPTTFFMENLTMIDSLVYEEKSVFAGYDDNQ